jgi:TonB family protein
MRIRIAGVQFEAAPHWGSFHSYMTGMPIRLGIEIYANGSGPVISEETKQIVQDSLAGRLSEAEDDEVHELQYVSTAPVLLTNERPGYPPQASAKRVGGLVILSAVFRADGRVSHLRVITGLPEGLTETAVETARRIRFQPATKDGQPVSVRMQLEYRFG